MIQKKGNPAREGIEGECLLLSIQKIDLGFKGAQMYGRCHEIAFFSHCKNEHVIGQTERQIYHKCF